jgi:hypothetical protein
MRNRERLAVAACLAVTCVAVGVAAAVAWYGPEDPLFTRLTEFDPSLFLAMGERALQFWGVAFLALLVSDVKQNRAERRERQKERSGKRPGKRRAA